MTYLIKNRRGREMVEVEPNPKELEEPEEKGLTGSAAPVTAVYAVVPALASLGGNHAMKEMPLSRQQASDRWACYQAKSIREHLYVPGTSP